MSNVSYPLNIREIEQYLSDNCSINVTGCYIISISEMYVNFGKFSSSRQIQKIEPRNEKTNILVSDLVRHKPRCTATEDGYGPEISDLESRGIVLSM